MGSMHDDGVLELAAAGSDIEAARVLSERYGGTLYTDDRPDVHGLPFRVLATVATDDLQAVKSVGDTGTYLIFRRLMKPGEAGAIGLFPMVRAAALSHEAADIHWRDVHAPLALKHHGFMTHYTQLSVVENLSGLPLDGFALCGFATLEDLRQRFYSTADGSEVIAADVARFADPRRSPRRLIVREERFG